MAYYATSACALEGDPTPENRVWGFFADPNKSRLPNRQQSPQPLRKNRVTTTKPVSGIPFWPSRDPIREGGGINLFRFVRNNAINKWDLRGLTTGVPVGALPREGPRVNDPCDSGCETCHRTNRRVRIADYGATGTDVRSIITQAPTFKSIPDYKDCCYVAWRWRRCYNPNERYHVEGGVWSYNLTPSPGAPSWQGIAKTIFGYYRCSCIRGTWKCSQRDLLSNTIA